MRLLKPTMAMALLAISFSTQAELTKRQVMLLANTCLQCHAREHIGVPLIGVPEDWKGPNKQGEERMLRNVIEGLRGMPPLGSCAACDENDLRALNRELSGLKGGK